MKRTIHFFTLSFLLLSFLVVAAPVPVVRAANVWTVQSNADDGTATPANCPGSSCRLRDAIAASGAGDTITFSGDYTITLVSTLGIDHSLTIDGAGHSITVSGNNAVGVFYNGSLNMNLQNLTVANGERVSNRTNGGGIVNNGGTLTVSNCTFSGNHAWEGGGIVNNGGTLTVSNSTFFDNHTWKGGGIENNGGTLTIGNSTFFYNSAGHSGGGILNIDGTLMVINSTFSGNYAPSGGGGIMSQILSSRTATLKNTIVINSSAGGNCYASSGSITADSHNLADDGSCGSATVKTGAEIKLQALANNGGPTQTMALGSGSAALDAGDTAVCSAAPVNNLDQRGVGRILPSDSVCDIGAYELNNLPGDANLSNLVISSGTFTPTFAAGTTAYSTDVPFGVTSITITPTVSDSLATITVNGTPVASGSASSAIALALDANPIPIVVTAQNGARKTYTLVVTRSHSIDDANLSNLVISRGILTPAFAADTTAYTATVPLGIASLTVTPMAGDARATITIDGAPVASATVALAIGPNTITTVVTAADGVTKKTYTLVVTRDSDTWTWLVQSNADDGTAIPTNCPGSSCRLRDAIAASGAGDSITFAGDYTITLVYSQLTIDHNLTIDGETHSVTVSGNNALRVFSVNSGVAFNLQNLTVTHGYVGDVGSSENGGSAIHNLGNLTVSHSTITGNRAYHYGAGIGNYGTAMVTDSTISNNVNINGWGGGIYSEGPLTITNSTFSGNSAGEGGGIAQEYWATMNVTSSTFSGNSALDGGGGIFNHGGTLNVTNSTFSGNSAVRVGGAIHNGNAWGGVAATLTVINSTFSGNQAPECGGGICNNDSYATLKNTIIVNSPSSQNCYNFLYYGVGSITAESDNLADDSSCSNATVKIGAEIDLQALANNGGSTQTMALGAGSAAIDAANPAYCPATDQRGVARADLGCDAGAFERSYADGNTVYRPVRTDTLTTFGPALAGIRRDAAYTDPGVITVTRATSWARLGPESIGSWWVITPTVTSPISVTLELCYTDALANSLSLGALRFWRFESGVWSPVGGAPQTSTDAFGNHCAILPGVDGFSIWTLATASPTDVRLASFRVEPARLPGWGWFMALPGAAGVVAIVLFRRKRRLV